MRRIDLTGQQFGRLLVLEMVREPGKDARVRCRCECGAETTVLAYNVRNGNTSSCGCIAREGAAARGLVIAPIIGAANRTHGMRGTRTYVSWLDARKRCHSPQNKRYAYYGGRGIAVCDQWRDSFESFLADMGECPPGLTLERLDNNKGYEPGNCVWATKEQQARNRRCNKATPDIVRQIRARDAAGEPRKALAAEYGMALSNVQAIVSRQTWRNVE